VIITVILVVPAVVVTENVPVELPAGTIMEAGTLAAALLDESEIVVSVAAAPVSVTIPVPVVPPVIGFGDTATDASWGARTVKVVVVEY